MVSIDPALAPASPAAATAAGKFYFAAWRWHFYAGLYVIPFLVMLAVTGLAMLWIATIDGRDGERISVTPSGDALSVSAQSDAALASVPGGSVVQYIAPRAPDLAALFRVNAEAGSRMVAIDPYTGAVVSDAARRAGWYDLMDNLHSDLLLGVTGDRMIEIAASLGMVLIATGLYLWWPRGGQGLRVLLPNLAAPGRSLWKSLHATIGAWVSLLLVIFLVSGLAWAGIWGEKLVQAWNTFPAEKFDAPTSDSTHAAMNHGATKEVPWALEQTPMPASGSDTGAAGLPEDQPLNVDTVVAFGRQIGFEGRFQLNMPQGEEGVWTLSRDSMSNDSTDPTADRTVHIDQYSGQILADVRFEDYSIYGQAMAVGIAFHMGLNGIWNLVLNTVFCLSVIFVGISGVVMWWMRRPTRAGRLAAPPMPKDMPLWQGAVLVGLAVSLAFPMAGLTLLAVFAIDAVIVSRIPALRRALS